MIVVTDAEYNRLTPIEKARYWANRYQDLEEKYNRLQFDNNRLYRLMGRIQDSARAALDQEPPQA